MAKVISPQNFVIAQNSAMRIDCATATEVKALGLQGMGLALGFTQDSTTVPMMGERIAPLVYTGASYDEMTADTNFIPGDKSQELLREAALQGTILKNIRLYIKDGCNFSAPDQPSTNNGGLTSGTSGLSVGSFTDPTVGSPSDVWTNSISFAPAGPFTLFVAHTPPGHGTDITIESEATAAGGATLTLATGDWDEYGFETGDTIILDWNTGTSPPRYGVVDSLTATVMTLVVGVGDAAAIEDAVGTANTAVHGATPAAVANIDLEC
jgi:hypothetical protein